MSKHTARMPVMGLFIVIASGCAHDSDLDAPRARVDEPIGVQMMRTQPQLKTQKFKNLLSFESDDDAVFVSGAAPDSVVPDDTRSHTGRRSLRAGRGILSVKLSSILPEGSFPGDWTLAGAYFYAPKGAEITISCHLGGALMSQRKLTLPPGKWTPAMLDVTLLSDMKSLVESGSVWGIVFEWEGGGTVWCDDLTLINNAELLFGTEPGEAGTSEAWLIRRRGLDYVGESPNGFGFKLPIAEHSPGGWIPEEINASRVRFGSTGTQKSVTIYADGRAYFDGEYRPLSPAMAEPQFAQQHRTPAKIDVPEDLGRVDRNRPGDANNDGYDESRGSYHVQAIGPRLELKLSPQGVPVERSVLEIIGMPEGQAIVNIEGRLVEHVTRLEDGTLLVQIPAQIDRPTSISVHVQ